MIPLTSVLSALKEGVGGQKEKVIMIKKFKKIVPLILSFLTWAALKGTDSLKI